MGIRLSKFHKRILSALVLAPVSFAIIWHGGWIFAFFTLAWAAIAFYEWVGLAMKTDRKALYLVLGVIYVSISFWCCYWLRAAFTPEIPLLFMCLVWSSDVGAYVTGKAIGGPKMASEISPNKTWAGFVGAFVSPTLVCLAFFILMRGYSVTALELLAAVITGVSVGIVGQAGDLVISFLKRRAGVKDSGQIIPGHGGVLDRVDALMLAAPVFLWIVTNFTDVFTG